MAEYDVVDPVIMCLSERCAASHSHVAAFERATAAVPSGSVFGTPHTLGGAGSEDKILRRGLVSPLRLGDAVRDVPRT